MKQYIIGNSLKLVKNFNPEFSEEKLLEIKYGLEAIYLTLTKIITILLCALLIGSIKETLLLMFFFNLLRLTGFGLHATKSWICWIISTLIFILLPYLCMSMTLTTPIKIVLSSLCVIIFLLFAPADTKKRPILNRKKRVFYRIATTITGIIFMIVLLMIQNNFLSNVLLTSMILEAVMICPLSYKLSGQPYNNYKNYQ